MTSTATASEWSPAAVRRAHLTMRASFAVHGAVQGTFATRIPWIKDHLGLSAGALGLALACPAVGSSLLMPLAGRLMHRYGSRTALRVLLPCGARRWRCPRSPRACPGCACRCWSSADAPAWRMW